MEQRILDEAIAHEREVAENHRKSAKYAKDRFSTEGMQNLYRQNSIKEAEKHEQLAEWLEELKAFRENKWTDIYIKRGYDKAIDDLMNKLCDHCMQQTNECYKLECPFCTDGCDIVNIAEQLKAGSTNGED